MPGRVAIAVRTHVADEKTADLLSTIAAGSGYDAFLLANESDGPIDLPGAPKIAYRPASLQGLGFDVHDPQFVWWGGDLVFSVFRDAAPGYDHYVVVEYDVHVLEPGFFERLAGALDGADLVGARFRRAPDEWMWAPAAARVFPAVYGVFYAVIALSDRAIPFLLDRRRELVEPVHCEAFTASALVQGGFRCLDLNEAVPGAYTREGFRVAPPLPLQDLEPIPGQVAHPVLGRAQFEVKWAQWLAGQAEAAEAPAT